MRRIEQTTAFRRDYKREKAGQLGKHVDDLLRYVLEQLISDRPLPSQNRDHPLGGEWVDFRDCHLRPDLLLIYRKPGRGKSCRRFPSSLGSHSELFRS